MNLSNPFRSKPVSAPSLESASDVRSAIASEIDNYLNHVDSQNRSRPGKRDKSLSALFTWGNRVVIENEELQRKLEAQGQAYKAESKKADDLRQQLDVANGIIAEKKVELENAESTMASIVEKHGEAILDLTLAHSESTSKAEEGHLKKTEELIQTHEAEKIDLQAEITQLVGSLLVNEEEHRPWPDDKLKRLFKDVQMLVESVTSPRHSEFIIRRGQHVSTQLDPTSFINRNGKSHWLLRSAIWSILHKQFFSAPFGFGAFGPRDGQRTLLDIYFSWCKNSTSSTDSFGIEDLSLFIQDYHANKLRTAIFQFISSTCTESNGASPALGTSLSSLSNKNVKETVNRIVGMLSEISTPPGSSVSREIEEQVQKLTAISFEIALQFGIHAARLQLHRPNHGDLICIGEDYTDCEDGNSHKGSSVPVDLVVVPGFQKFGDGRADTTVKRSLAPCEFYPQL